MLNLKMLIHVCILFVISLALPLGNAFACTQPCSLSTECEYTGDSATFQSFSSSPIIYHGHICHPNTDYEFYSMSGLPSTTTGNYMVDHFSPSGGGYYGGSIGGNYHYKINLVNNLSPGGSYVSSDFIVALELTFVNTDRFMMPEIQVDVFDINNNLIYSDIETTTSSYSYGSSFSVSSFVNVSSSKISHVRISTIDKHGLVGINYKKVM